jgi:hypothetical protein
MRDASTRRSLRTRWTAALAAILVSTQSIAVFAQTDEERAGARAAATEGAKAFEEGRYADAIDLFTRAQSLVKAPTHLLFLARSQEKLGQLVAARESYLKIKREQLASDAPQAFQDAQQAAMGELAALEPRLPYVKVVVEGAGPKPYTVTMDGVQMANALVGVPVPADPGEHKFQATAEGLQSEVASVTVKEGAKETIALKLVDAPGAGAAAPVAAPATGSDATPDSGAPPTHDTAKGGSNGMKIGAYAALGVGVVGLGLGTVFALKASSKRGEADDLCNLPGGKCPADKKDQIDSLDSDADSASGVSVAGFVVGGLGVAAGVTLLVLSSKSSSSARAPAVTPWVGYKSAGVLGRF